MKTHSNEYLLQRKLFILIVFGEQCLRMLTCGAVLITIYLYYLLLYSDKIFSIFYFIKTLSLLAKSGLKIYLASLTSGLKISISSSKFSQVTRQYS